jgi:hypothetical protein
VNSSLLKTLFFGNYFYGLCTVALSVEATLQQGCPLNHFTYFIGVFALAVWYYTLSYSNENLETATNQRTIWYSKNVKLVRATQWISMLICAGVGSYILLNYQYGIYDLSLAVWSLILVFPVVAIFYYGIQFRHKNYSLRNIGWIKPFVIGFVWAGFVTAYPVIYQAIVQQMSISFTWVGLFLFVKNFMFITVLAIMFDIKDYATDSNRKLKTYVVEHGLRATIFEILIPLSIVGLGSFLMYGLLRNFSGMRILLNTIPFLMMLTVAYYLHRRQSIFYYLVLIDGLMLVKALCGIIAVSYF